jgi:endonuclease/exonuclease/phosphatase family metal-dependent hydrolase
MGAMRASAILLVAALLEVSAAAAPPAITVASYNLENYVGPEAAFAPGPRRAKPKSAASVAAITTIVREIAPDILGVCEMGSPAQLAALQTRLREAGLDYPETEFVHGPDRDRHLALLSRLPIVARHSQPNLTFDLNGAPHKVERGLLDVTVRINETYDLRLIGAHLKSKLPVPRGESLIRRHEAAVLRAYIEAILTAAPETNLLLYGDFNDARNEPPIQAIAGPRGTPFYLDDLAAADPLGDRWTHYWQTADIYARIDYFFASRALIKEIAPGSSRVYRGAGWKEASDHRAIFTSIIPFNRAH